MVTTVSDKEVRVSVGSADTSKALYVHRPGVLSQAATEITKAEYDARKSKAGRSNAVAAGGVFKARKDDKKYGITKDRYYAVAMNPKASDGKFLLTELIRKPMKLKIKSLGPALGKAIAERVNRG